MLLEVIWINRFRRIAWMQQNQNEWIDQIRFWHISMQNFLFIINCIKHLESKESFNFTVKNQKNIFIVFVRIFYDENTISHETHFEQWIHTNSTLSKIENKNINKKIANHEHDESWIRRTYSLLNKHAIDLKSSQWVTNMQWIRSRTKNHLITLSTFCQKMTNNIENLFEQIFEKQLYRIWSRMRRYVVQAS